MVDISDGANYAPTAKAEVVVGPGEFQFAAVGLDHGHINGQCNGLLDAGATLKWVYDPDPQKVAEFVQRYPGVQVADRMSQVLTDSDINLVTSAVIPNDRAELGRQVLAAGKDYFTDKSPFTSLEQLSMVRDVVSVTRRKYMVYYAERLHNDAAWTAGEMIKAGAIGRVLQVLNIAPHRLARDTRPLWFFDKDCTGGILTDIGSHQVEQFLTYAGCHDASINFARVANMNNPTTPDLEDFGEISLTGDNGASFYTRVDWFTPDGLRTWGDGRTFIVGTEGTMELRKYLDVAREAPSSRLFLVNGEGEQEIECLGRSGFPFFGQLILDSLNRTEHAMTQRHAFKAAEISLLAQRQAEQALASAGD
ncbi:Gfo/Idh/MocA family oxidoreductase [Halieaceae bacterium IMCC14734]|uniref:Gfo/Idh/MocA family oxidoreductase n=1 Tax=Candidatus Litorirhabdus singularis TaxID=2518993 RepID=A0ABT3TIA4_9GAMM|nr:Gfo/Idh/MocA family oxidoreductase [Candidatus Litorirhabdus singularis]MCX2982062.1 Gfo/Idh/MocA family oxidoreductase [Candidatus Litorirhabdus singularis]